MIKPDLSAWDCPNVRSTVIKKGRKRRYPIDKTCLENEVKNDIS
jgi:hypothetical protein